MVQEYTERPALKLCIFFLVHFLTAEARLTVTPIGDACPGEDMTFTCRSNDPVSNVRWTLMSGNTEVIPQFSLTQGGRYPNLYEHYNNLPILVTLYDSYSTLNITADVQLHGITVECLLIGYTVERETVLIQITQPPSSPSDLCITKIHNGSYSATVELVWDFSPVNNATYYTISISSNGETWFSTATMEVGKTSITLSYNTAYTLTVKAINCAGHSGVSNITDIFIANCSAPTVTNAGLVVEHYNSTIEGAVIYFNCDDGIVPNEQRMAVCQSNGQWSPNVSNITCEQGNSIKVNQTLLTKELFLQCENDSVVFQQIAECKDKLQEALNPTLCSDYHSHSGLNSVKPGFICGRVEMLVSFTVAGFVLGMICGVLFLSVFPYLIKKRCEAIKKNKIELSQNMAYETIPPKLR